jgi:hypothetical protein
MRVSESTNLTVSIGEELAVVRRRYGRLHDAEVRVDGNVVTCLASDHPPPRGPLSTAPSTGEVDPEGYVHDAVAVVVKLTRQRVSRFSSFRRGAHGVVEIFALEPTTGRGRPRA